MLTNRECNSFAFTFEFQLHLSPLARNAAIFDKSVPSLFLPQLVNRRLTSGLAILPRTTAHNNFNCAFQLHLSPDLAWDAAAKIDEVDPPV